MYSAKVLTKHQVVIPCEAREQFNIMPGKTVVFFPQKETLRLVIVPPIEQAEGFPLGMDTGPQREE